MSLSADLGVSHTTVEKSYLQLTVEGYVSNVPRSGYRVNELDTEFLQRVRESTERGVREAAARRGRDTFLDEHEQAKDVRYDFSFANLQSGSFPLRAWRKVEGELFYTGDDSGLTRYSYSRESNALREELAAYLGKARGVRCLPEQVVLQAGTDCALNTLFALFDRERDSVGIEEPGYPTAREVARRCGFQMAAIPTDLGAEAFLAGVEASSPHILFATPSHQFPTGRILQLDSRTRLLKWAAEAGTYIIEDDSCNEFRYDVRPVPSLQSLDAGDRVIYLCNASKVLAPGLRVAYLVLPPDLLERYYDLFNNTPPTVPWTVEETLARFMAQGYWDQHVRRMANGNRKRHDELMRCLGSYLDDMIEVSGQNAGMHLFVTVRNGMTQEELLASARAEGAAVYGTKRFWFSKEPPECNVLVGFSAIALEDIEPGVAALARAWA